MTDAYVAILNAVVANSARFESPNWLARAGDTFEV